MRLVARGLLNRQLIPQPDHRETCTNAEQANPALGRITGNLPVLFVVEQDPLHTEQRVLPSENATSKTSKQSYYTDPECVLDYARIQFATRAKK